jgi:hypothetical protein
MRGGVKVKKCDPNQATIDNFIYGVPTGSKLDIGVKKRGRGRPRKRVAQEGLTIHQEPAQTQHSMLSVKDRHEIRKRYDAYQQLNPSAELQEIVRAIADERELIYKQVYDIVAP